MAYCSVNHFFFYIIFSTLYSVKLKFAIRRLGCIGTLLVECVILHQEITYNFYFNPSTILNYQLNNRHEYWYIQ